MFGYQYDRTGARCASGPQPGAVALMRVILDRFAHLNSLGIYNCRQVRGGTTLSLHGEGRAGDTGVPATAAARAEGSFLAATLVATARQLGVQEVIWWRQRWASNTREWRPYTGVHPHTDHVHWGLCWEAARQLTAGQVLAAWGQPAPRPPAPPSPPTREGYHVPPTLDLRNAARVPVRHTSPVRKLQGLLLAHGYTAVRVDGVAGPTTQLTVVSFQRTHRLAADAIVGARTWRALIET